jgi:hypothetical protein
VFGFGIWRNVAKRRKARAEGATDDNPEDIADTDADEQVAVPGDGETGRD